MRNLILMLVILISGMTSAQSGTQTFGPFRGITYTTTTGQGADGIDMTISGAVTSTINTRYKVVDADFLFPLVTTAIDAPTVAADTEWAPAWNLDNVNQIISGSYTLTQSRTISGVEHTREISYSAVVQSPVYVWGGEAQHAIQANRFTQNLSEAKEQAQILSRRPTTAGVFQLTRILYQVTLVASQSPLVGQNPPNLQKIQQGSVREYTENGLWVSYTGGDINLPDGQIGGTVDQTVTAVSDSRLGLAELIQLGFSTEDLNAVNLRGSGTIVFYDRGVEVTRTEIIEATDTYIEVADGFIANSGYTWIIFLD